MTARIYRPARSAMQSGKANTKSWILEFVPDAPRQIEPLMGWTGMTDTKAEVKLSFETKEEALAFAQKNGIAYRVEEPAPTARKTIAYSDNFKFTRIGQWTH